VNTLDFIAMIIGDDAPRWRLAAVWSGDLDTGGWWDGSDQYSARCELPWQSPTPAGWDFPCPRMGSLDLQGRHVCADHWDLLWTCAGRGTWLPEGTSGYCSQACTAANHATQTWLGQRLGARYLPPAQQP
jgi:hypothetical protein